MLSVSPTVPHALIKWEHLCVYHKRIDRIFDKDRVEKRAMEDFCQLDFRLTQDKYHGCITNGVGKSLSGFPKEANLTCPSCLFALFFYITGNSDMHLKEFLID